MKWKEWIIAQFCKQGFTYIIPLFEAQALEIAYSGEAGEIWKGSGVFFPRYCEYSFEGLFTVTMSVKWKEMRDENPEDFEKMVQDMLQDYPHYKFPGMWSNYPQNSKKRKAPLKEADKESL